MFMLKKLTTLFALCFAFNCFVLLADHLEPDGHLEEPFKIETPQQSEANQQQNTNSQSSDGSYSNQPFNPDDPDHELARDRDDERPNLYDYTKAEKERNQVDLVADNDNVQPSINQPARLGPDVQQEATPSLRAPLRDQRSGCDCGPKCDCGCQQGRPCNCAVPRGFDNSPDNLRNVTSYNPSYSQNGCGCGPSCDCGCVQGNPCTCETPKGFDQGGFDGNQGYNQCDCGCQQGYPCTCGPEKQSSSILGYEANSYEDESDAINTSYTDSHFSSGSLSPPSDFDPCRAPGQNRVRCGFDTRIAKNCCKWGVWLPEDPVLFRPLMADPREVTYSAGWRFNDQVLVKNVIDVSFGDSIPFYRLFLGKGALQIDLEGALWVTFDPLHDSSPLINADYYGGLVLTYGYKDWSFRLRGFHISSHIGDEFLLDHPDFDRRNASAEYVDLYASYDLTDEIRLYGGAGWVVAQDDEFHVSPFYAGAGVEVRMHGLGFTNWCNQVYGEPIMAMHFRYSKDFKKHVDSTYILGYEWGKICGLARKVRLYMEYHDGYSLEGQFAKRPTNYFSIRISYGY